MKVLKFYVDEATCKVYIDTKFEIKTIMTAEFIVPSSYLNMTYLTGHLLSGQQIDLCLMKYD